MSFAWGPLLPGGAQQQAGTAYGRTADASGTGAVATLAHREAVRIAASSGAGEVASAWSRSRARVVEASGTASLATAATLAAVRVAAASASGVLAAVGTYASGSAPPPRPFWYQLRRRPGFDGIEDARAEQERLRLLRPPPRENGILGRRAA